MQKVNVSIICGRRGIYIDRGFNSNCLVLKETCRLPSISLGKKLNSDRGADGITIYDVYLNF